MKMSSTRRLERLKEIYGNGGIGRRRFLGLTAATAATMGVTLSWGRKALDAAAISAGMDAAAAGRLFPGGAKDAVAHFMDLADRLMIEDLKATDLAALKIRTRIACGVKTRLARWTPHREAVRRALALSPLPPFAGGSLRGWYRTVDIIWRAAGDRSTDFNFYTKRLTLAAVFSSTLRIWLDDVSPGHEATWAFLDRRIEDVMAFEKAKQKVKGWLGNRKWA